MMFDPKSHLIRLPRRVKDPETGQWVTRQDEYLEVKWRVVMFREKHPGGSIITEEMCVDLDRDYARFKAHVGTGDGGMATGTGTEFAKDFADYCERAETRAIGRALALLGFGTQFVLDELSESQHVADAPTTQKTTGNASVSSAADGNLRASEHVTLERPTEGHISALTALALKDCAEDREVFADRLRRTMGLQPGATVTPRLLSPTMTMAQFMAVFEHYTNLKAQLARKTPEASAHAHHAQEAPAPESEPAPTGAPAAVPSPAASSSAREDDAGAVDADRAKLRAEVATWDLKVNPAEIEHIITHHSYSQARALLWKYRRTLPEPALAS
jgi:hypothetical protein